MTKFLSSSLGKKMIMGLTGFLLVGFVIMHLLGNLTLLIGDDGQAFRDYADKLHGLGPFVYVAEALLVILFGTHIWMAFRLTRENRAARSRPYEFNANLGESTVASRNMFATGAVVLGFIIIHLAHFRAKAIQPMSSDKLFDEVVAVLSNPFWAVLYIVAMAFLGVHLSHGFRSAFQSLGINHPKINCMAQRIGIGLAVIIAVGFAAIPVYAMLQWGGQS